MASVGTGLWFLVASIQVAFERDAVKEPRARRLFGISILYLFALFAALIVEQVAGIVPFAPLSMG